MKIVYKTTTFICLVLLIKFSVFSQTDNKSRLTIIHTNDMHGQIDNFAKLGHLYKKTINDNPNTILVSAGDNFSGNPIVDQFPEKGFPIIDLMNKTGFSYSALGNHAFDYTAKVLTKRILDSEFQYICCNIEDGSGKIPEQKPYTIHKFNDGFSIGIIGFIQVNDRGIPDAHPDKVKGMKFIQGIEAMKKFRWLKDSCDVLIALSHLGYYKDIELAEAFPEIDVIISAHNHISAVRSNYENNTMIAQAGAYLNDAGVLNIEIQNRKVSCIEELSINLNAYEFIDTTIQEIVDMYNRNSALNEEIAIAEEDFVGIPVLGCLMTDALTEHKDIDIAFQNYGGIRLEKIEKGPIKILDVYRLDPFNNEVFVYELTSTEIKDLIKAAFYRGPKSYLQVSGINVQITTDKDEIQNIELSTIDGSPLENRSYKVALNSYIASTYTFNKEKQIEFEEVTTATLLLNYLKSKKKIVPEKNQRVVFSNL